MSRVDSLDSIFRPRSVAVIGVSERPGGIGRAIFQKLLQAGFAGPVYPVHPSARAIAGVRAYPDIEAVPDQVDLAVIAVPRRRVHGVAESCARAGVRGLIVITAGFRETGRAGAAAERELAELVRAAGMRMIGPNCMGVINTDENVRLDATFAPETPTAGNIGFVSQSGALGATILDYASKLNLGVSMFVSIGNKADVAGNDLLAYWENDASIDVILMYLESFGRPAEFARLARRIGQKKPVVVVKAGRSRLGARAAASHTGALAGADRLYDAMFRQCGIVRAATIEELFDFAMALANQPLPAGKRVAIITNAGGPAILATDACERLHLSLPMLGEKTQARIREHAAPEAVLSNPVDLLASADYGQFGAAVAAILDDPEIDSVLVLFVQPLMTNASDVAAAIADASRGAAKPVLGCLMGLHGIATGVEALQQQQIPVYAFPENAARALRAMYDYQRWKNRVHTPEPPFPVDVAEVRATVLSALENGEKLLVDQRALDVLRAYGIPVLPSVEASTVESAEDAADGLGYPVVAKLVHPELPHKTELGGVALHLADREGVREACHHFRRVVRDAGYSPENLRYLLQPMLKPGRELVFGIYRTAEFGPMLAFGLGGIFVEALDDVNVRFAPLTRADAEDMLAVRAARVLESFRGSPPVEREHLVEMLLRLSQLATDVPEIAELDINPMIFSAQARTGLVADVRILLQGDSGSDLPAADR